MNKRQFQIDGVQFALNLKPKNGFNAKYSLLYFETNSGSWHEISGTDTIKEARKIALEWMKGR